MKSIIAFDIDHTLQISNGDITLQQIMRLKKEGHILGLCGNWGLVTSIIDEWENLFSFIGAIGITKILFLSQLKRYVKAERYIFIGNDPKYYGESDDITSAKMASWEFYRENQFDELFESLKG